MACYYYYYYICVRTHRSSHIQQYHIVMASRHHPPTVLYIIYVCPIPNYCFTAFATTADQMRDSPNSLRVLLVRSRNRSFLSNLLNMLSAGNKNTPLKFHCSSLCFIFARIYILWKENPHLVPTGDREQHTTNFVFHNVIC